MLQLWQEDVGETDMFPWGVQVEIIAHIVATISRLAGYMVIITSLIVTEAVCIYDFVQCDGIAHGLSGSMCLLILII